MRLSRPCYDKPHRCPGWAHGGWVVHTKRPDRCDGGYVDWLLPYWGFGKVFRLFGRYRSWQFYLPHWWFGRCKKCGVVTWPFAWRKLDPTYWTMYVQLWKDRRKWEKTHA
jgi:hypothetical protein